MENEELISVDFDYHYVNEFIAPSRLQKMESSREVRRRLEELLYQRELKKQLSDFLDDPM